MSQISEMFDLSGKVAVVTGAGSGLGRTFARTFAQAGAKVVVSDVAGDRAEESVEVISADGGNATAMSVNAADPDDVQKMADEIAAQFGEVHVLVNNAGIAIPPVRIHEVPIDEWNQVVAVNLNGVFLCTRAVIPLMLKAGGGSIINISSLAATYGMPFALDYATSKAAVIGITRSLARELGRDWIRVNAVGPSAVLTEGTNEYMGDKKDKALQVIAAGQSLKSNLTTDDMVGTIVFLASDASKFITGQTVMVDGGTVLL